MARSTKKPKINLTLPPLPTIEGGGGSWPLFTDHVENWAWRRQVFLPHECATIIALANQTELDKAQTYAEVQSDKVRNSFVKFMFPNGDNNWIFSRMTDAINEVNAQYFKFDLTGMEQGLQFTKYSAPAEHYDWHVDRGHLSATRKLSVSVLLSDPSDYKGGALEFKFGRDAEKAPQEHGLGVFFPSYTMHRVAPVTKGTRYSLVAWVSGPPFR